MTSAFPPMESPVPAVQVPSDALALMVRGLAVLKKMFAAASMMVLVTKQFTVARVESLEKAPPPIEVTELGMVTLVRELEKNA